MLDSKGQPVTDLTAGDFKVADQGKSQTILLFRSPVAKNSAELGPHEYTNRPGGLMPHAVAILFDLLNEGDANRLDTWRSLAKSIPQLEAAGQVYFYILGLDGELIPIRPIGPRAAAGAAWLGTFDQELNKAMEKANGARPGGLDREDRAKRTYHQLEVVSNQLAALPGRRDLVWIANIMPAITNSLPCDGDWVDCGTYEIAYAPSAENWDNKFHKIRVTCERKGVKLQVQERYYVLPDSRAPGARQTEILKATYQRPSDAAGIGLGVRMLKKALTD